MDHVCYLDGAEGMAVQYTISGDENFPDVRTVEFRNNAAAVGEFFEPSDRIDDLICYLGGGFGAGFSGEVLPYLG